MSTPARRGAVPAEGSSPGVRFSKGHGTANDFVLIPDPDGAWDPTPAEVAAICARRTGVGADGLVRAVRAAALEAGAGTAAQAEWFMDYRNSDGSLSEMCGNGIRVYAEYLLRQGLVPPEAGDGRWWSIGTRGGVKRVRREADGTWTAHMGRWHLPGGPQAARAAGDALVSVPGLDGVVRPALSVDLGNPHTVVALASTDELAAADLTRAPTVDPVPPNGTNVELVVPLFALDVTGDSRPDVGEVAMRVHERGSGETMSCGTGACAAALATRLWAGPGAPDVWRVDVPGGRLVVTVEAGGGDVEGTVLLGGPAEIVADGFLDPAWLARPAPAAG